MKKLATAVAAVGTAAVLVLAYDAATYAGTGSSLILGKVNKSSKVTTLTRTSNGPALSLTTKSGPPLAVSSKSKVAKLNADLLDGKDAAALETVVHSYAIPNTAGYVGSFSVNVPDLPPGTYLMSYSVAGDTAGTGVECVVTRTTPPATIVSFARASGMDGGDGDFGVSATAPITVAADETVSLFCGAITNTFGLFGADFRPSTIDFVPVGTLHAGAATLP